MELLDKEYCSVYTQMYIRSQSLSALHADKEAHAMQSFLLHVQHFPIGGNGAISENLETVRNKRVYTEINVLSRRLFSIKMFLILLVAASNNYLAFYTKIERFTLPIPGHRKYFQ
jgi:hypothetical protein